MINFSRRSCSHRPNTSSKTRRTATSSSFSDPRSRIPANIRSKSPVCPAQASSMWTVRNVYLAINSFYSSSSQSKRTAPPYVNDRLSGFLKFPEPDPTYSFTKPLPNKTSGFTRHETYMECTVSSNMAQISWYKGKTKLEVSFHVVVTTAKFCLSFVRSLETLIENALSTTRTETFTIFPKRCPACAA